MRGCEVLFMDMISRLEWKRQISFVQRKQWYYKHLRFWDDYIKRHCINLYISAWIPHEIPDIIIYYLCKHHKIPVLYFNTCTIRDTSFAEHDIEKSAYQIGVRYAELLEEFRDETNPNTFTLDARFSSYYDALASSEGQSPAIESIKRLTYWGHIRQIFWRRPIQFILYGLGYLTFRGISRLAYAYKRWRTVSQYERYYDSHAEEPDLERPFVYLPLHFQPEASTNPMGGSFRDQSLMVEMLNAHLPDDTFIYIKEHQRKSGWLSRSEDFYKGLLALNKVRFIPRKFNTFALREHCCAVATVTGTAGFEAIFRGKPVLLFGYRFYQYASGVYNIRSSNDCQNAVQAIFTEKKVPKSFESKMYLQAMQDTCIDGVLDPWKMKVTHMPHEHHVNAMEAGIFQEIKKLKSTIEAVTFS